MNKEAVYIYIYIYTHTHTQTHKGIQLNHKKEYLNICNNMDELGGYYAK